MAADAAELDHAVRRGLGWSALSNLTLRLSSLALGVALARLLAPEEFGVYAVALTVQTVLLTLADLGLSADLIRSADPAAKAPTVATLGLVAGASLAALAVATAGPVAGALGSPGSADAIAVLSLTLLLAGVGVVPYAALTRAFQQKRLFAVVATDVAVGGLLTIVLVLSGAGVMALAVGRVGGHLVSLGVLFLLAEVRPRWGFDRRVSAGVLRFGTPVALANLLSWALLSLDTVVIARGLGSERLGYYVLAFNVSTWPMSVLGQVVRSVALPAFARGASAPPVAGRRDRSLATGLALSWAVALPAGALISLLAEPLVEVLYGARWRAAAAVLVPLGLFGAVRVGFDLLAAYLLARGEAAATLRVQVWWFLGLAAALPVGIHLAGLPGAGWAHVLVAAGPVLVLYARAVHRAGADLVAVAGAVWPPVAAMVPTALVVHAVAGALAGTPLLALPAGGAVGVLVYALLLGRWVLSRVPARTPPSAASAAHPRPSVAR